MTTQYDFGKMEQFTEFDFGDGIPVFYMGTLLHYSGKTIHLIKDAIPPKDNLPFTSIIEGGTYTGKWYAAARKAIQAQL